MQYNRYNRYNRYNADNRYNKDTTHKTTVLRVLAVLLSINTLIVIWRADKVDPFICLPILLGFFLVSSMVSFIHWFLDTWTTSNKVFRLRLFNQAKTHHYHPHLVVEKDAFDRNDDAIYGCILFSAILLAVSQWLSFPTLIFGYSMTISVLLSLEIHRYAHLNIADVPWWIRALQRTGFLLSKESHLRHHGHGNYSRSYNLMSGWMNRVEDATGIYPALEWLVIKTTGLQPRTYLEDAQQKRELDDYYERHLFSSVPNNPK